MKRKFKSLNGDKTIYGIEFKGSKSVTIEEDDDAPANSVCNRLAINSDFAETTSGVEVAAKK